jgi:hypothetical protein
VASASPSRANFLNLNPSGTQGTINGNISVSSGSLTFNQTHDVVLNSQINGFGSIIQNGAGTLTLTSTCFGGATIASGTLELGNGGSVTGGNVAFAAPNAMLRFDTSVSQLGGNIAGAVPGDSIDLAYIAFAAGDFLVWNAAAGQLLLVNGHDALASLTFSGQYVSANFTATPDKHGGTLITLVIPGSTTANMMLRHAPDGKYEIYNIGNNAIVSGNFLGQVGTDWQFAGLGNFFDGDTSDMLLRNSGTGGFQVYDISNNNIINSNPMGAVGLNWQVMGFGNFSSLGETDMILRNVNTGGMQVYDISNNQITGSAFLGTVGLNWQMAGVSNHGTQSDLVLRDSDTGGLEIYNIANDAITGAAFLGAVGLDWQPSGFGDFSSRNEGDMLLRNVNTGGLMLYDIANNQITGTFFLGNVGLDWQYAGVAPIQGPGTSDLVLRNVNTGAFQVYNIAVNILVGSASSDKLSLKLG